MNHFPRRTDGAWRVAAGVVALGLGLGLGGCASRRDGGPASPPANLATTPDAVPRVEPIRPGGPNKPYQVMGRSYQPFTEDLPFSERGIASWYGSAFHGKPTANGEIFDMYGMTAAHPTIPLPSYARVRNPANGREVVVRINDRGPFHPGRIIDLSYAAAVKLDVRGVSTVELRRLTADEIRRGNWDNPARAEPAPAPQPPVTVAAAPPTASTPVAPPPAVPSADSSGGEDDAVPSRAAPAEPQPGPARERSGFWVQLGAFSQGEAAQGFLQRVAADQAWVASALGVFNERGLYRLQAGPYGNRAQAQQAAQRLQAALQLTPVVLELR